MRFRPRLYLQEMTRLLRLAGTRFRRAHPRTRVSAEVRHRSFAPGWEERSEGRCWRQLEPALVRVGELARDLYAELPLDGEAEVVVNSHRDWCDRTWTLRGPAI